jgi:hypothetical protein
MKVVELVTHFQWERDCRYRGRDPAKELRSSPRGPDEKLCCEKSTTFGDAFSRKRDTGPKK